MTRAALDPSLPPVSRLVLGLDHQPDERALLAQIEQFLPLAGTRSTPPFTTKLGASARLPNT